MKNSKKIEAGDLVRIVRIDDMGGFNWMVEEFRSLAKDNKLITLRAPLKVEEVTDTGRITLEGLKFLHNPDRFEVVKKAEKPLPKGAFVVRAKPYGASLYIKELRFPVQDSLLTLHKSKAQPFLDREYIHEKLRDTCLAAYQVEYVE
jgi:hypothetical protein